MDRRGTFHPHWERKLLELLSLGGRKSSRCGISAFLQQIHYCVVWCGVTGTFILGPYFFENVTSSDMQTCSITGARYKVMLENYVIPNLQQQNVIDDIVWIQDCIPPYIATNI